MKTAWRWIKAGVEDVLRDDSHDTDCRENINLHADKPPHSNSSLNLSGEDKDEDICKNINGTLASHLTDTPMSASKPP